MSDEILVINAGSSSLKFSIFIDADDTPEVSGNIDGIGQRQPARIVLKDAAGARLPTHGKGEVADHGQALLVAIDAMAAHYPDHSVKAVGHRIVHGGADLAEPTVIDAPVLAVLESLVPLVPLHQPHCLNGVRAAQAAFPDALQVACFDTAFHRTMPETNQLCPIPRRFFDEGVRRYGFHGLSYDYIASALRRDHPALAAGRVVVAHLGNGASLCGMRDGRSVATTMGFSALDGLIMGTRSGHLDPGVLLHLLDRGMDAAELSQMLYHRSGLLGISEISNDMRVLLESDDPRAAQAVEVFAASLTAHIAAMAARLGGIDALIFTAGIGENAAPIRARVCEGLAWLGLALDAAANDSGQERISTADSTVAALVIPTREDLPILHAVRAQLAARG